MDVRQYLQSKGFEWRDVKRPSGQIAIMNCPVCKSKEKSFAVSLKDGAFNCLRLNNCGVKGSFWELQKIMGDKPVMLDSSIKIRHESSVKYIEPKTRPNSLREDGYKFLLGRGFTRETIKRFRIGQKDGALMLPSFWSGKHITTKFRSIKEKKFWNDPDTKPVLFNMDMCDGEGLAIVEGHQDCMALAQYTDFKVPVVSVPNGVSDLNWIELCWDYLENFNKIYLMFDNDNAGQGAIYEIVNRLGAWRCYNVLLPEKDMNECLMKNISVEVILKCLKEAKGFDPIELKKLDDFYDRIFDLFDNPQKAYGVSAPYRKLNDILRGFRERELTVWTGTSGSGKTNMLNDVIIQNIKNKHKTIVMSLEMSIDVLLQWIAMNISGEKYLTLEELKKILQPYEEYLYCVDILDMVDGEKALNILEYAARKYGIKHFIIDSLFKIFFKGSDEFKEHTLFINKLISNLAYRFNGHVHLVAHPRKGSRDGERPGKVDVSGTANITNLAHNVLIVWRPDQDRRDEMEEQGKELPDNVLYVKKNRRWGSLGKIEFDFNPEIKKFIER